MGRFIISTGETWYTFCVFLNLVLVLLVVRVGFPIVSDWNNNPRAGKYEHTHTTDKLKAIPHHFVPFSFQHVGQHLGLHVHPQTYRSRSTLLTHTHAVLRRPSLCWRCSSFDGQREQFPQFTFWFLFPQKMEGEYFYIHSLLIIIITDELSAMFCVEMEDLARGPYWSKWIGLIEQCRNSRFRVIDPLRQAEKQRIQEFR